jgi:hypothetical protein
MARPMPSGVLPTPFTVTIGVLTPPGWEGLGLTRWR